MNKIAISKKIKTKMLTKLNQIMLSQVLGDHEYVTDYPAKNLLFDKCHQRFTKIRLLPGHVIPSFDWIDIKEIANSYSNIFDLQDEKHNEELIRSVFKYILVKANV